MRPALRLIFAAGALTAATFATQTASAASLDACGDIFIEGSGSLTCEVYVDPGECKVQCTPISFEAECAAELKVGCDGMCNATVDVGCTGTCQGTCEAECNGGSFDCNAYCEGNCTADCSGKCSAAGNKGECQASCEATCQGECNAGCTANPPDCTANCQGCCTGECKAEANIDCQIDCQASGYVDCKASLQGGCEGACDAPEGALFCDGQFISTSNVESCVAALEDAFNITVTYYANAECSGNTCKAEAGVGCSTAPESTSTGWGAAGILLGLASAGLTAARRVRRRKA